jgi:hypothetical protein
MRRKFYGMCSIGISFCRSTIRTLRAALVAAEPTRLQAADRPASLNPIGGTRRRSPNVAKCGQPYLYCIRHDFILQVETIDVIYVCIFRFNYRIRQNNSGMNTGLPEGDPGAHVQASILAARSLSLVFRASGARRDCDQFVQIRPGGDGLGQ